MVLLSPAERSTTVPDLAFVILYVLPDEIVSLVAKYARGRAEARARGRARRKKRQRVKIMMGSETEGGEVAGSATTGNVTEGPEFIYIPLNNWD